jgi:hypothetical protein
MALISFLFAFGCFKSIEPSVHQTDEHTQGVESTKTGQPGALPTNGVCDFFDKVIGYGH